MKRLLPAALCLVFEVIVSGCAAPRIELVSGLVTTGGDFKFEEVPVSDVHMKDTAYILTHLRWSPATDDGGLHDVQWLWYSGDQLVHAGKKQLHFRKTPYRLYSFLPATGLGHSRVNALVDGVIVDTREFNVVS